MTHEQKYGPIGELEGQHIAHVYGVHVPDEILEVVRALPDAYVRRLNDWHENLVNAVLDLMLRVQELERRASVVRAEA